MLNTRWQASASRDVLTIPEVADELRCSKAHVHNLINGKVSGARPLPALWLGRRRLVCRTSLDAWIRTNEHATIRSSPEVDAAGA